MEEKEAIKLLNVGWTIDQSILCGIVLINSEQTQKAHRLDLTLFLKMRKERGIKQIGRMTQAHPLFHGRVDIYGLT